MIRFYIFISLLFIAVTSIDAQDGFKLSVKMEYAEHSSLAHLYYPNQNDYITDSCYIKDGHFNFSGLVEYPVMATLEIRNRNTSPDNKSNDIFNFYLENDSIFIVINKVKGIFNVQGSRTHDLHMKFLERLNPIWEEMNNIRDTYNNASREQQSSQIFIESLMRREEDAHRMNSECVYQFTKEYPDNFISLYLLQSQLDNVPDDVQIVTAFSSLSETIKESSLGRDFDAKLQKIRASSIGSIAPEFDCKDIDGNLVRLSDFKGRNLLLVFWASDCDHCLEELPNILKVSNLSDGKDLTILSVSVDSIDREEQWRDFVRSRKLPWINMFDERINGKKKISNLYNVRRTPSNFLLDKNGEIIAKNLYGEDLIQKISTILHAEK